MRYLKALRSIFPSLKLKFRLNSVWKASKM